MTLTTPSWTRTLKVRTQARGDDKALIKIVGSGPRETGMMTLKRDGQLWSWLPRAGRVMKVPSGMLGDSWMGSDFTNDDLVQGASIARDFDAEHKGTVTHDGRPAWLVVLVPKKTFSDFAVVGWQTFPKRTTAQPEDPTRKTSIVNEDIAFDIDIPDKTFLASLARPSI